MMKVVRIQVIESATTNNDFRNNAKNSDNGNLTFYFC